jgi:hypothetical protein
MSELSDNNRPPQLNIGLDMKRAMDSSETTAPVSAADIISPNDRAAAGKALREKLPREHHGAWIQRQAKRDRHFEQIGRGPNEGARADPIWPNAIITFSFYRGLPA